VIAATPTWNLQTLTAGVYYHAMELSNPTFKGKILFHTEDDMGLISVHETEQWDQPYPAHTMKINGKFMSGDGSRVPILHAFAHLPIFMRADGAKSALVIGLGGGLTAEAVLEHPFDRVEVAEISPGVIEGAHRMRPDIFEDPRLKVIQEDARSLLLTGDQKYDVIVSETSDPWMTGVSNLYTLECFRYIRDKLAPHGVFGTWLQTRHKRIEDVRIILRTMQEVFPHMALFQIADGDTLLIMSNEPLRLDVPFLEKRYAEIAPHLRAINLLTPWQLMGNLVMNEDALRAYLAGARINTDDLPVIEFSTPRSINLGFRGREVWDDFIAHAPRVPDLPMVGDQPGDREMWETARAEHLKWYPQALEALERAERQGATDPYLRGRILFGLKRYEDALAVAEALSPDPRQALLKAASLLHLERYVELDAFLRDGEGWKKAPVNNWEERILYRRTLMQQALGVEPAEARAQVP
jgi:hypothetical protein